MAERARKRCPVCGTWFTPNHDGHTFCCRECVAEAGQRKPPTPDEIQRRCREVQSTWTDEVEIERRVTKPADWEPPVLPATMFFLPPLEGEGLS